MVEISNICKKGSRKTWEMTEKKSKNFLIYNSDNHSLVDITRGMCKIFKVISNNQHNVGDVALI